MDGPLTSSRLDWRRLARTLRLPTSGIVDGERRPGSEREIECVNPATLEPLAAVAAVGEEDVDNAVGAARRAFRDGRWSTADPGFRKSRLLDLAAKIVAEGAELALMDSLSMGKPAEVALQGDVPSAVGFLSWFAECTDKLYDEVVPSGPGTLITATREPLGVVALVTPWNYPLEEAAIKLAPALAAGNSVVLKPSELSPYSAIRLGELALEAGIPPGVLNILPGTGPVAGRALALHSDVDCIAFTGSTAVGKLLMNYSGASNLKRVWLECGGKSPTIVFADCQDLGRAAAEAARSVFRNQGEVCSAGSRLLIERSIATEFIDMLLESAKPFVPGDPLDPSSLCGAVASRKQHEKILRFIDDAARGNARLVLDGRKIAPPGPGYFVGPTIFAGVSDDAPIMREEIFGPVLCVSTFDNEDEAVRRANDSDYGLVASVWTSNLTRACQVARRLAVGSVSINGMDSQSEAAPFGGCKQSGFGREHSLHAFAQYTGLKTTWYHH